ncbi:MAG: NTP transferase domain-containing protein [Lentimicrobiaceae bacterium]|nr:NTP transferase domain-containing protein [Lentimicrobiaceae bacterium]
MRIIIPMAGIGKRMRPHTLTIPKPLLPIAGKPIVQRLVEEIVQVVNEPIEEIAFVIGEFGKEVETQLIKIAESVGAKGSIYKQLEALGTAHAILCAKDALKGKVVVAYADTLFKADFKLDDTKEGIIWSNHVAHPEQFGVIKLNADGSIEGFYEKPKELISNLAIIGIYYFRDGENLRNELQFLLDKNITTGGEYGITDALQNMMKKGVTFHTESVSEWLDCGNKEATIDTNSRMLLLVSEQEELISPEADIDEAIIIEPCYIGKGSKLVNTVIGPYVSIGENTTIVNSIVRVGIIGDNTKIENKLIEHSMIGNNTVLNGRFDSYNVGDYNQLDE